MLPGPEHYRRHHEPKDMSTDDIVACFELTVRLRSFEPDDSLDHSLEMYLSRAWRELEARGELERVRGYLPVYVDPARRDPVYGTGAEFVNKAAVQRAIQAPCSPVRAISAG